MRNENPPCLKQIMLRVPQDLRDEIERAAAAEKRSMANLTRVILEDWLAARAAARRGVAPARVEAAAQ